MLKICLCKYLKCQKVHKAVKNTTKVTSNLFRVLNFTQRFMRFNELTILIQRYPPETVLV